LDALGSTISLEGHTNAFKIESCDNQHYIGENTNDGQITAQSNSEKIGLIASDEIRSLLERKNELTSIAGTHHSGSSGSEDSKYNSQEIEPKSSLKPQSVGAITSTFVESKPVFDLAQPSYQMSSIKIDSKDNLLKEDVKVAESESGSSESIPPPLPQRRNSSATKLENSHSIPSKSGDSVMVNNEQGIEPADESDQLANGQSAETATLIVPAGLPKTLHSPVKTLPSLIIKDLFRYK
jgi:hypothetical protein